MAYNFKNIKVLVADDDATIRLVIANIFRTLKVRECLPAVTGNEALEIYKQHKPDLILTDWQMQDMDGLDLCAAIRKLDRESGEATPIILMSGFADESGVKRAIELGVNEFLLKPFSVNDLAARVAYVIDNPRECVITPNYFGPDRRRRDIPAYDGPERRKDKAGGDS